MTNKIERTLSGLRSALFDELDRFRAGEVSAERLNLLIRTTEAISATILDAHAAALALVRHHGLSTADLNTALSLNPRLDALVNNLFEAAARSEAAGCIATTAINGDTQ